MNTKSILVPIESTSNEYKQSDPQYFQKNNDEQRLSNEYQYEYEYDSTPPPNIPSIDKQQIRSNTINEPPTTQKYEYDDTPPPNMPSIKPQIQSKYDYSSEETENEYQQKAPSIDYSDSSDDDGVEYEYKYNRNSKCCPFDSECVCCNEWPPKQQELKEEELKENDVSDDWQCLASILNAKHKKYGNAYKQNAEKQVFNTPALNALCRYCLMTKWSEDHKKECLFIPVWVQNGNDEPSEDLCNVMVFNGHHYRYKDNE